MILGFWGLTVFPDKTYTQTVDNSFKLSMAALDEDPKEGRTSLRVTVNNKSIILCSLTADQVEQQRLDLIFTEGEVIVFSVSGENAVHLSGNYLPEDYDDADEEEYDELDEEEDDYSNDDDNTTATMGIKHITGLIPSEEEDENSEDDPDFTGEDEEDDDDDNDDDDDEDDNNDNDEENDTDGSSNLDSDEEQEEDNEKDNDDVDDDDDEDEDEDEVMDDEIVKAIFNRIQATSETTVPTKKQKVSEEKTITTKSKEEATKKTEGKKKEETKKENKRTLPSGLIIEDVKVGEGARAKVGKKIGMRYVGRLENGKVFDKNTSGKAFSFNLGRGEVIKGWDIGIQGMQLNGERRLTIPPGLAYGSEGFPPDIPRNATLVFEVKLVSLK